MAVPAAHYSTGMSTLPPPIQHHDEDEWNVHRETIKQKYIYENQTTLSVQRFMEESYEFKARYANAITLGLRDL